MMFQTELFKQEGEEKYLSGLKSKHFSNESWLAITAVF